MTSNVPDISGKVLLSSEEYERRKQCWNTLKGLSKPEYVEMMKLLKKHNVNDIYENTNGMMFDVKNLPQTAFDALELFLQFAQSNRRDLANRESFMSSLVIASPDKVTLE